MIGRIAIGLVFVVGCGSSSPSDGSHMDAPAAHMDGSAAPPADAALDDFGCGGTTACPQADVCCAMPGQANPFMCTSNASCPVADQINCDGPDECGGTTPVCCGVDTPDGTGSFPTCGVTSLGTNCTTAQACPTHIGTNCHDTTKVQICHVSAECSDQVNNKCCTFMSNGAELTFCIDQTTANLGGGVCH